MRKGSGLGPEMSHKISAPYLLFCWGKKIKRLILQASLAASSRMALESKKSITAYRYCPLLSLSSSQKPTLSVYGIKITSALLGLWSRLLTVWLSTVLLPTKRQRCTFEQNLNFGFCPTRCLNVFLSVVIHLECYSYRNERGGKEARGIFLQSQYPLDWPELTQAQFPQTDSSEWSRAEEALFEKGSTVRQKVCPFGFGELQAW